MIKILFICHGNICRSPMAEFIMKDLLRRAGRSGEFHIESAATTAEEIWNGRGNPVYPQAAAELRAHGIGTPENELGLSGKRARLLTRADYERFDYIVGMDAENMRDMKRLFGGDPEEKLSLLMEHGGCARDVADPWYTRDFRAAWNDVESGCRALLRELTGYSAEENAFPPRRHPPEFPAPAGL